MSKTKAKIYKIEPRDGSELYYMIAEKKHWWSPYVLQPNFWRYREDGALCLCEFVNVTEHEVTRL